MPAQHDKKMKQITEQEAFFKLSAMCAAAEHCRHEMSEKMARWQLPDDVQDRIMQRLVDEKYIDEERYCRFFVRDKIRYNKWGRRKVEQALMMKRIPRDIISGALDEVDAEEYIAVLRPLLQSKRKTIKAASEYELNAKLIRFAMGRGFDMDIIRECLDCEEF